MTYTTLSEANIRDSCFSPENAFISVQIEMDTIHLCFRVFEIKQSKGTSDKTTVRPNRKWKMQVVKSANLWPAKHNMQVIIYRMKAESDSYGYHK